MPNYDTLMRGIVYAPTANLDGSGNLYSIIPISRSTQTILNQASAAQTASGNSGDINVSLFSECSVDCSMTAFSGTTPSIIFYLDRKGLDGVYYPLWTSATFTAATVVSTAIGAGMTIAQCLGSIIRLRWVIAGTTPSITFSASIIGK
jgi:hypothetical protein